MSYKKGYRIIDREEVERKYFEENKTFKEIAIEYGCCPSTIGNILRDNPNYKKKPLNKYTNPTLIENYFENIDTERKAYFLGLMITDGNVGYYGEGYQIRLQMKSEDSYILEEFKKDIQSSNKLIIDKRDNSVTLSIKSKKMFYDLSKYGVVPNKTLNNFIPNINYYLANHLIRGIIDGDGWVSHSIDKNGKIHNCVGICGNKLFLEQIKLILMKELFVSDNLVQSYSNLNNLPLFQVGWYSLRDIRNIYCYLYGNASIFLTRKFLKYKEIF